MTEKPQQSPVQPRAVRSTDRLFRPRSIAVVGGSWARSVIQQCQRAGFDGDIWPVHPQHQSLLGLPCFRSVDELPSAPDAVFIGVNRHATIEIVRTLNQLGAGGVVCFASGFSEAQAEDAEGGRLQQLLIEAAGDMPMIGPNCYGLINYLDGALLWPDQHGGIRVDSGVAIITQSSNIAINLTMQQRALPIAYVLTAGNQAQLSLGALGEAVLADPRVTALGLYIEGFGDVPAFEQMALRALSLGKPIIAIKAGRSEQARQAMVSHTNSLSGADTVASAFLKRLGIARVLSLTALVEALKLVHVVGALPGTAIQSMSCSGGEAGLMSDSATGTSVTFPALEPSQGQALREALGPMVALANPLDYHTYIWGDQQKMTNAYAAMMKRNADLTLLVMDYPRTDRCDDQDWHVATQAFIDAQQRTGSRAAVLATLPEAFPESIAGPLMNAGIAPMMGIGDCMEAVEAAAVAGSALIAGRRLVANYEPVEGVAVNDSATCVYSESDAKRLLANAGLTVPRAWVAESVDDLQSQSPELAYPVVLKGAGIAHKTEHQAVRLNLNDADELVCAARDIAGIADTFLVETYIDEVVCELLVSVVRDPVLGFALTLASGGIYTEIMQDAEQLLLPVQEEDIRNALGRLRIAPILSGYRGQPPANVDSIVDSITQLQAFALTHASTLHEIEINPLLCRANDAIVADALIVMAD